MVVVRCTCLPMDSDHVRVRNPTSMADQQQWLQEGLAASTATWKFVFFHHPAYTSGAHHGSDAINAVGFCRVGGKRRFFRTRATRTNGSSIRTTDCSTSLTDWEVPESERAQQSRVPGSRVQVQRGPRCHAGDGRLTERHLRVLFDRRRGQWCQWWYAHRQRTTIVKARGCETARTTTYRVDVAAGEVLAATVRIPAAGPGQLTNELDVGLVFYDPSGVVVAAGASESLWHTVTAAGTYSVRVLAENGTSGEYVLHVDLRPLGDMDGDGDVDMDDTDALALALRSPAAYEAAHGLPAAAPGDTDGDGDLDFDDIDEFVALLTGGSEAVFGAAASAADRTLSASPTESVLAALSQVWPAVGARAVEQTPQTGRFEEAETPALFEGVHVGRRWQLDPPQEAAVARTLTREGPRASAAKRRAAGWPPTDEQQTAIWSEDADWLPRITYD